MAHIAVHVQDLSGKPIQGAEVSVGCKPWKGTTNSDGNFDFGDVPPGQYTVDGKLGSVTASPQTKNAPAGATTVYVLTIPCKPISSIVVTSMAFLSDHRELKNDVGDWKNGGTVYPRPDWTPAVNHPVSHNMDKPVQLVLKVTVNPSDACPEVGTWEGTGPDGLVFPPVSTTFNPGENTITVYSSNNLQKKVQKLHFTTNWTAKSKSGSFSSVSSNYCLVTIDKPINDGWQEDGATTKRMVQAIDLVSPIGSTDAHTIVAGLMLKIPFYTLERDPAVPSVYNHPKYFNTEGEAWPISDYLGSYAECQAIVRWVRAVIKQIGCPGTAEPVAIWADPDVSTGATVLESPLGPSGAHTLHGRTKVIGGKTCRAALAALDPVAVGTLFTPGSMMNMYEACLKFTDSGVTKYYGGGAGVYTSKDTVIKAFYALVWYTAMVQPDGSIKYRIEEIVHRYR